MDFASSLYEITQLDKEIKTLNTSIKKHRDRKKVLMNNILSHLIENNKSEIQVNGKIIKLEEHVRKSRKREADKKVDVINVLKDNLNDNVNAEDVYKEIKKSWLAEKKEYKLENI